MPQRRSIKQGPATSGLLRKLMPYLLLVASILAAGACDRNDDNSRASTPGLEQGSYAFEQTAQSNQSQVQWILPTNMDAYRQQMTDFAQTGGTDPFPGIPMVRKPLDLQGSVEERARSLAHKTASAVLENRPGATKIVQFQLQNHTAYIQFGMDVDGWAGVSVAIAMVHPLVALNLKQFPQIDTVRFEAPPGED